MFSTPRPAPSRAALKRLYQLAYISSGTAAGLATLCAEERRRRTNYVQTIADNAKRLQQSPKHVSNAARAAHASVVGKTSGSPESGRGSQSFTHGELNGLDVRSVRAPELPSFVGSAYNQLAAHELEQSAKQRDRTEQTPLIRNASTTKRPHRAASRSEPTLVAKSGIQDERRAAVRDNHGIPLYKSNMRNRAVFAKVKDETSTKEEYESPRVQLARSRSISQLKAVQSENKSPDGPATPSKSRVRQSRTNVQLDSESVPDDAPRTAVNPRADSASQIEVTHGPLSTALDVLEAAPDNSAAPETVAVSESKDDLERTLASKALSERASTTSLTSTNATGIDEEVAGILDAPVGDLSKSSLTSSNLDRALRHGTLDEIRTSIMQLLASGPLSEVTYDNICNAWPHIAELAQPQEVTNFYTWIFHDMDHPTRVYHFLHVASRALSVRLKGASHILAERDLLSKLSKLVGNAAALDRAVETNCQKFLSLGSPRCAFHVIEAATMAVKSDRRRTMTWLPYQDEVAASLLEHDDLVLCAISVASCIKMQFDGVSIGLVEDLLSVCQLRHSYYALSPIVYALVDSSDRMKFARLLSDSAKATLAAASFHAKVTSTFRRIQGHHFSNELLGALPLQGRATAEVNITCDRLWHVWRTQRDWNKVWRLYKSSKSRMTAQSSASAAPKAIAKEIEVCLVQIMNEANQPDKALMLLSDLFKEGSRDARTLTLIATSLAAKKAWPQVDSLLSMIKDSGRFTNSQATTRDITNLVKIYSKEHTAAQTWQFVTDLVVNLGFVPTREVHICVLQSFVRSRELTFVPCWIRHAKVLGHGFRLDANMAVKLLNGYYYEQRPPSTLLVHYCKRLASAWPGGIDNERFSNLIKASAGYDLRKARGRNRKLICDRARQHLANLDSGRPMTRAPSKFVVTSGGEYSHGSVPLYRSEIHESLLSESGTDQPIDSLSREVTAADWSQPQIDDLAMSKNAVEKSMVLALSLKDYAKVMDQYYESLSSSGLPQSTLVLEIAIEASVRKALGGLREASRIMADASSAGMDTRRAMAAYTIHKIYSLSSSDRKDVSKLQNTVLEYYKMNAENGLPIKQRVGTTAADVLINNRLAKHAVNLLNTIYNSSWVPKGLMDLANLTVYMKAYTAQRDRAGVRWVLQTVLAKEMTVDRIFLDTLKACWLVFRISASSRTTIRGENLDRKFARELKWWRVRVSERRNMQRIRMNLFGQKLVRTMLSCARQQELPPLPSEFRMELEQDLMGEAERYDFSLQGADHTPDQQDSSPQSGAEKDHSANQQDVSPQTRTEQEHSASQQDFSSYEPFELVDPQAQTEEDHSAGQQDVTSYEPFNQVAFRRARGRLAPSINLPSGPQPRMKRTAGLIRNREWVKRYRLLFRRDLIMPDGNAAAFRFFVGSR